MDQLATFSDNSSSWAAIAGTENQLKRRPVGKKDQLDRIIRWTR